MKRLGLAAMILAMVLCAPAARADFYVIAVPAGVGTKITSVPCTISTPGFYYLPKNLTYSGSSNAITVTADDVTLDLMGFSLSKDGAMGSTFGVHMAGRSNVEIRNGTVRGFQYGIYGYGSKNRIINIRVSNSTNGIMFTGANHLIKNCNVSNNFNYGISLGSGVISDCVASGNNYGIALDGPGNVLGNTVFDNNSYNFYLGIGVPTAIMADRNSAFGLSTNYYVQPGTTGVQWGINAGSP